ncbi:MAG: hypothetical protein CMJ83_18035 [Planctomycetes bacterium]|nr:hypothetical protein [Planctomycetota bacterium]
MTWIGLFLPWVEVDPAGYGPVEDLLADVGLIPEAGHPFRGFEIPSVVEAAESAMVLDDLTHGRVDRVVVRMVFREHFEETWPQLVFLPALLGLLHLLLARWPGVLAGSWLLLADVVCAGGFGFGVARMLGGGADVPIRILGGVYLTLGGLVVLAAGCLQTLPKRHGRR